MLKKNNFDQDLIKVLKESGSEEYKAFAMLYKHYSSKVTRYLRYKGCNKDMANDIFQDTLIILYKNVKIDGFTLTSKLDSYLIGIANNLWLKHINNNRYTHELNDHLDIEIDDSPEKIMISKEAIPTIDKLLDHLEDRCKEILVYTLFRKYPADEIARIMGFKNEQNVYNKKNKCLKYLKNLIEKSEKLQAIVQLWQEASHER